jgi:hypothetical protein
MHQNCFSETKVLVILLSSMKQNGSFTRTAEYLFHYSIIPIYIQQDATLHSLFYLETALRVSGGTITHHQGRKQLYLQHLVFITPLLLPAAIATILILFLLILRLKPAII